MYVILASKPGQYRTLPAPEMHSVEAYDYLFYGRKRGHYVIARMNGETKVRIVDETESGTVNLVPTKFLPHFETIELARRELARLAKFGSMDIKLVKL